jgi:hypothetical protein
VSLICGVAHADGPAPGSKPTKQALFNVISNDTHQYFGVGPYPILPVERWETGVEISGFAPGREDVLKKVTQSVVRPVIDQMAALGLPEFRGARVVDDVDSNPNVLLMVGDDFSVLMDRFPHKDLPVWQLMFARARQVLSETPDLTCGRIVGSDQGETVVAAIIFIATRDWAGSPEGCASTALPDILGLRGSAGPGESIKSIDAADDQFKPLDVDAFKLLYGKTARLHRQLGDAVDDYLTTR